MFEKILGAIAGDRVTRHIDGMDGPLGAALGMGAATVIRRLGPWGFVAVAVGGYALKRYQDKKKQDTVAAGTPAQTASSEKTSSTN